MDLKKQQNTKRNKSQNKPSISPFLFNLILSAAGTLGSPGIVIIDPQTTTTNSAPLDNLTSLMDNVCPEGAPFNLGSVEKLY